MLCTATTPRAVKWLNAGLPARVLNLFDEACNLVNDEGTVVSLVSNRIGMGPFSMIIDGDFTGVINADMPITIDSAAGTLSIGPLSITTHQAKIWDPRPEWRSLKTESLPGLDRPPTLQEHIKEPLQQLISGITNENLADCRSGAFRLAGLGSGLTPTGDDVLMGVLYALWAWFPRQPLIHFIMETAVPRTTTLSAAFLRAAADGEASIHWHDLVNGRSDAVEKILAIGHTSGREAWTGFTHLGHSLAREPRPIKTEDAIDSKTPR